MPDNMTTRGDKGIIAQTGEHSFDASDTIIKTVRGARSIYERLRSNHLRRKALYTEIDGLLEGNPPYSPATLRAAGLDHIANFNDMSAAAVIERACLAYWNLLYTSEHFVRFVLHLDSPEAAAIAKVLSREWDWAVKNCWPSFNVNVASMATQLVKFGISPVLFNDERSPQWRVVELSKFYIPDQTQSDIDLITTVCVETEFTVQYLWGVYQTFKNRKKEDSPWNIEEVGKLLARLSQPYSSDKSGANDILEMQRKISSGDIAFDDMLSDTVRLVSLFQREYGGKVSHYIFHWAIDDKNEFLFKQESQYEDMHEAIVIFTMSPGKFTIHQNRGLGHKIYSLAQAKIQTDCSLVDMAKWASTPILKSPSLSTKDIDQVRFFPGVPTNIGPAELVQNNLGANVQNVVTVAEYLKSIIEYNIAYSGSDPARSDPDRGSDSPLQTRLSAYREFGVMKNNINHFYSTMDWVVRNMTAKMLRSKEGYPGHQIAKEWKERCEKEGVPKEVFSTEGTSAKYLLPRQMEVYATRSAGAGSQAALLLALQEMQVMVGSFGVREEKAFKELMITATIGHEYIATFLQDDDSDARAGGASVAGLENSSMQEGHSPIFSPDNDHRAHFEIHITLARNVMQGVQEQQMDVVQADKVFTVLIPHLGEHFQALGQNQFSQQFFMQMKPAYEQVVKYAQLNRKNAERHIESQHKKQQERAEQQDRVMTEEELKTMQVMNEERRKDAKLQAQSQRQEEAGAAKEAALNRKTEADAAIQHKKVVLEAVNKRTEIALKPNGKDKSGV